MTSVFAKISFGKCAALVATVAAVCLPCLASPAVLADDYEALPVLDASKLFADLKLKGEHYEVVPKVSTDGFLTRTVIKSDYGTFVAVGPDMLRIRLHEIDALSKLEKFESSDEFQRGAEESVSDKTEGLKQLVDHPKESAEGISAGVGRFFKRVARATKTGVQKAEDILDDKIPGMLDEPGLGANLPGSSQGNKGVNTANKYRRVAGAAGRTALNILGFDDSRRRLAKRLAVDPYTTNRVLDEKLDEITRSIFAGDLTIDIATSLIPGGMIVGASTVASNWIWDTPPGDLRVEIEQMLLDAGVSQENIDRFLRNHWYPLSWQAFVAKSLAAMDGVQGRADLFPLILTVTSFDQARFLTNSLQMTAQYHKTLHPVKQLKVDGTIVAVDVDDTLVVAVPTDYTSWVRPLDTFVNQAAFKGRKLTMYVAGVISGAARKHLVEHGWMLHEHSQLLKSGFGLPG